jgi:hypothetical protein
MRGWGDTTDGHFGSAQCRLRPPLQYDRHGDGAPGLPFDGFDGSPDSQKRGRFRDILSDGDAGGTKKNKFCKTNPNLFKPAWNKSFWKAKNEPKFGGAGGEMGVAGTAKRRRVAALQRGKARRRSAVAITGQMDGSESRPSTKNGAVA